MSKKLFSLISGESVHISTDTKLIPAAHFSKAIEGEEIIDHVKKDAKNYRMEVVADCEAIKEQAYKEGFEAGFKEWAAQLASMEAEITKVRHDMERVLASAALKAAQKIVGRELETSEDAIVSIVSSILKSVAQHKKITIYTSPEDLEMLEKNRPRIREIFESLESLSLRERADIQRGGCIIETEGGIINARLENQWKILENAFKSMFSMDALTSLKEEE